MPFPNEHSCRVKDPADFQKGSFRRKNIDNGIDLILGRLQGETTMTKQAYRFKKSVYTQAEAKEWLKKNKITCTRFEPAAKCLTETFFENLKL